ncbi:hypothetical protein [Cuspidothrix issatschenkoi]|nr:hypothetical protein [Cuspidothrix issatschenkoi]
MTFRDLNPTFCWFFSELLAVYIRYRYWAEVDRQKPETTDFG